MYLYSQNINVSIKHFSMRQTFKKLKYYYNELCKQIKTIINK